MTIKRPALPMEADREILSRNSDRTRPGIPVACAHATVHGPALRPLDDISWLTGLMAPAIVLLPYSIFATSRESSQSRAQRADPVLC